MQKRANCTLEDWLRISGFSELPHLPDYKSIKHFNEQRVLFNPNAFEIFVQSLSKGHKPIVVRDLVHVSLFQRKQIPSLKSAAQTVNDLQLKGPISLGLVSSE